MARNEKVQIQISVDGSEKARRQLKNIGTSAGSLTDSFFKASLAVEAVKGAISVASKVIKTTVKETVDFAKESIEAYQGYEKSMMALEVVVPRFGVDVKKAQEAAVDLGKELRIGTSPAAEGLMNLMKGGLNLPQAIDMMKRFANEAINGKSANLDLSTAVQNLAWSYSVNNSMIGNAAGISENYSDIIKRGREILIEQGEAVEDITEETAKYAGMIDVTNLTLGAFEASSDTAQARTEALRVEMHSWKELIGKPLNDALNDLLRHLEDMGIIDDVEKSVGDLVWQMEEWWKVNKEKVIAGIDELIGKIKEWWAENKDELIPRLKETATAVKDMAIEIGKMVLVIGEFIAQNPWILKTIGIIAGIVVVVGIVNSVITAFITLKGWILLLAAKTKVAMAVMGTVIAGISAPVWLVIAAFTALGILIVTQWDQIKAFWEMVKICARDTANYVSDKWEGIKTSAKANIDQILGAWYWVRDSVPVAMNLMKTALAVIWSNITFVGKEQINSILNAWRWVRDTVPPMAYALQRGLRGIWNLITADAKAKIDSILGAWYWARDHIPAAMRTMRSALEYIFTKIKNSFQRIFTVGAGKGYFENLAGVDIPFVRFATGGVSQGGMAMVGEQGPELTFLPQGTKVVSNRDSMDMIKQAIIEISGGGKSVNFNGNVNIGGERSQAQGMNMFSQLLLGGI